MLIESSLKISWKWTIPTINNNFWNTRFSIMNVYSVVGAIGKKEAQNSSISDFQHHILLQTFFSSSNKKTWSIPSEEIKYEEVISDIRISWIKLVWFFNYEKVENKSALYYQKNVQIHVIVVSIRVCHFSFS